MYERYRFTRRGLMRLMDLLSAGLNHPTKRSLAIDGHLQICIALRFYVTGTVHTGHGDHHGGSQLGEDAYVYINRKRVKSINVQLMCNSRYKITNVVARWPGSAHDSRILQHSSIGAHTRTRVFIEQVNGQLKMKFLCLMVGLHVGPKQACRTIVACAVLFNLAKDMQEPEHEMNQHLPDNPQAEIYPGAAPAAGLAIRAQIAQEIHNRL
ncbi:putative nuclease HARBI1 [Apostichopus japonicus]|uniref:putative nuclease HARBI1 n=1 Tax=Stichopus japonicus TaxID=307972 RepID=UPI003AB29778